MKKTGASKNELFIFQRIGTGHNGGTGANYFGIFIVTVAPVPLIMAALVPIILAFL